MGKRKIIKSAAAVALGASVVTTAVAPGVASAATKYKVNSKGNLVLKSTGSLVKGWVEFGGKLYKNGKPAPAKKYKIMGTGASMKLYFGPTLKKGYKTANSKSLLFKDGKLLKGNKQTADRARYYENGKLATGWDVVAADETKYIYKSGKLFKEQKTATRDGVLNYFENGKLAEGTKAFQDTLFTDGTVDEKDQVFEDVLYVGGKKAEGTVTFEDVVYVDGVKDTEKPEITAEDKTVEYGSEAVDVATLATVKDNSGEEIKAEAKISFDGKAVEKIDTKTPGVYTVTFTAKDKNGNEAEAKEVKVTVAEAAKAEVESVKAINAKQIKVTFNKTVDASTLVSNATTGALVSGAVSVSRTAVSTTADQNIAAAITGKVSEDGKSIVLTLGSTEYLQGTYAVTVSDKVEAKDGKALAAYAGTITVEDKTTPTVEKAEFNPSTGNIEFTVSEPITTPDVLRVNGTPVTGISAVANTNNTKFTVAKPATVAAGSTASIYLAGAKDYAGNILTAFNGNVAIADDQSAVTIDSVKQLSSNKVALTFNKPLKSSDTVIDGAISALIDGTTVAANNITFAKDTTDKTNKTVIATFSVGTVPSYFYGTAATKDVTFVVANNVIEDVYGQKVGTSTKSVTMTKDVTGPKAVSTKLSKDGKYIDVTFDEVITNLTAGTSNANITLRKDGVAISMTDTNASVTIIADENGDNKVLRISPNTTTELPSGAYTVRLASGTVADSHTNLSDVVSGNTTVDSTTTDLKATTFATPGTNHFTVEFNKSVTAATALNAANYKLDGSSLPEGTDIYFDSTYTTTKVHIVLPKGSINIGDQTNGTKARLAVSGVQTALGQTVLPTSDSVTVKDNTSATVKSVSVVGNTIFVKFNENLLGSLAQNNFDITVDGVALDLGTAGTGGTAGTAGSVNATIVSGQTDTIQITVAPATEGTGTTGYVASNWNPAKTIAVAYKGTGLTDANGFAVSASKAPVANK